MITKIKDTFKSEDNKRILSNTISLSSLQFLNLLFPLITFPYLVSVLGVEKFGLLALSSAVIMYFQIITKYGFELSGVQQISANRDNNEKLIEIFSSIISVKIILMLFTFVILNIFIFSIEKFFNDWLLYYVTFGLVLGDVLFPVWFFQGMEDMKWITYLNIGVRIFFTVLIFVFIKNVEDYIYVPILTSIGMIIAGMISLYIINTKYNIKFKIQSLLSIIFQFRNGWYIFTSRIAVSMYTTVNVILLGYFTNNTIVGYFDIANRLINITVTLINSFTQAIYPNLAQEYSKSKEVFYNKFKKILLYMFPILVFITLSAIIAVNLILPLLVEGNVERIISIFMILSCIIVLIPYGALFTYHLVITNHNKLMNKIIFTIALLNIILVVPAIYVFNEIGLIITMVTIQLSTFFINFKYFNKIQKGYIK